MSVIAMKKSIIPSPNILEQIEAKYHMQMQETTGPQMSRTKPAVVKKRPPPAPAAPKPKPKQVDKSEPPKKRGRYTSKVCDTCHNTKRKCDGGTPCGSCESRGLTCLYNRPDGRAQRAEKRRAERNLANKELVVRKKTTVATHTPVPMPSVLLNHGKSSASDLQKLHVFYLRTYRDKIDCWLFIVGKDYIDSLLGKLESGAEISQDGMFVVNGACAIAARTVKHDSMADSMLNSAKALFGTMSEEFTPASCLGWTLISGYYNLLMDVGRTDLYSSMAAAVARNLPAYIDPAERADCMGKAIYPSILLSTRSVARALEEVEIPRDSPIYSFRLRSMIFVVDMCKETGSMLYYVEDAIKDPSKVAQASSPRTGGIRIGNGASGPIVLDVWGVEHSILSEDSFNYLNRELGLITADMHGRALANGGAVMIEGPEGNTMALPTIMATLLRVVLHWKGGKIEEAKQLRAMVMPFLEYVEIQYAPPCFLMMLCLLSEFAYWDGDLQVMEDVEEALSRMTSVHARAEVVLSAVRTLMAHIGSSNRSRSRAISGETPLVTHSDSASSDDESRPEENGDISWLQNLPQVPVDLFPIAPSTATTTWGNHNMDETELSLLPVAGGIDLGPVPDFGDIGFASDPTGFWIPNSDPAFPPPM